MSVQGQESRPSKEAPTSSCLSQAASSQHLDLPQAWGHGENMPGMASRRSWLLPTHHALFLLPWKWVVIGSPFIHPCGSHKPQPAGGWGGEQRSQEF